MRFHTVLTFQVAQELTSQKFVSFPGDAKGFTVPVSPRCTAWHRGRRKGYSCDGFPQWRPGATHAAFGAAVPGTDGSPGAPAVICGDLS